MFDNLSPFMQVMFPIYAGCFFLSTAMGVILSFIAQAGSECK